MKKVLRILMVAAFSIFLMLGTASALTIDFAGNSAAGTVSSNGTYAWGADIPIFYVTVFGAPDSTKDGHYYVGDEGIFLSFDTGHVGNFIDISSPEIHDRTYVTGSFSSYEIIDGGGGTFGVVGRGPDTKNPDWLEELSIPRDTQFAFFSWSANADDVVCANGICTGTAITTDIRNRSIVPEPATMLLLGLGLLGVAGIRRKFKS